MSLERLIGREVERVMGELERSHPRALEGNPEGGALVAEALRRSIWLGLKAGCKLEKCSVDRLESDRGSAWEDWWRIRELTPEAQSWPGLLSESAPQVVDQADELAGAAALELDLQGRAARSVRHAGAQAAEAGAALARALSHPIPAEDSPTQAVPARVGAVQSDGTVGVAFAANQAEAELLQGVLGTVGIPSTWRRTGGDYPGLLAAGYREIYVPKDAADEARAVLATFDTQPGDEAPGKEERPTRKVGLERTTLRLAGKVTAALILMSWLWAVFPGYDLNLPLTLLSVAVFIAGMAAILGFRE